MQFTCDAFTLFFLSIDDQCCALPVGFIDCFKHHIKGTGELISLRVCPSQRGTQGAFSYLDAIHDLTQVHQWPEGNLQEDEIQCYTDQPAHSNKGNKNDSGCIRTRAELCGQPCTYCGSDENNSAIGNQYSIEDRNTE